MPTKSTILLLGKLPPPYMGPAIATSILLHSELKKSYNLIHFDTRLNKDIRSIGSIRLSKVFALAGQYLSFSRSIRKYKPDVVLVPISQSKGGFLKDSIFILIASILKCKVLVHLRGSEFREIVERSPSTYRQLVRWILRKCSGAIVLGKSLRPIFHGLVPDDRIFVCPNGCNLNLPERNHNQTNRIRLLSIGNLQASKGIPDILEAIRVLPKPVRESVSLVVLGAWRDESTRIDCMRLVEENQLPVEFVPSEQSGKKVELLSQADVFLFTPRSPEGHPWVIVEALAAGLPIITTNRGAIAESVTDGENGYIVPLRDPAAIAERLMKLIANAEKRQRMGRQSRKTYESAFTEELMVERLDQIIRQTLQSKP